MPRRCCCTQYGGCCSCDTVPSTVSVKVKSGTYTLNLIEECHSITGSGFGALTYEYNAWEGSFPLSNQYFPWDNPFDFTDDMVDVSVDTMNIRVMVSYDGDPAGNNLDNCYNRIYLEVWFTDSAGSAQSCVTTEPSTTAYGSGQCVMSWVFNGAGYEGTGGGIGNLAVGSCTDCRKMHLTTWTSGTAVAPLTFYNGSSDPRLTPATAGTNCILANFDFFEAPGDSYPGVKWIPEAIVSTNTTAIDCCDPCIDATTKTISTGTLAPNSWTEIGEWVLDQDGDCTWSAEFDITDCFQTIGLEGAPEGYTASTMKMTYSVGDAKNPAGDEGTVPRIFAVLYDSGGVPFQMTVYSPTAETDPDPELDGSLVCTPYTATSQVDPYPNSDGCPGAGGTPTIPGVPMFIGHTPAYGYGSSDDCYSQVGGWAYIKV